MSLTLINEVGSATANSFVSLATAGLYIEENQHISATWASLSTASREASLIFATSLLDAEISWIGEKATSTQALRWPRSDAYDADDYAIDDDIIPIPIQKATSLFGYFLSQSDRSADSDTYGFKQLEAGSLNMVIDKYDRKPVMPSIVWDILKAYGTRMSNRTRILERR